MKSLPQSAIVKVADKTARRLLSAAEQLAEYANRDFYDPAIQQLVHDHIRQTCLSEFNALHQQMTARLREPPYVVLVRGLKFDHHYRLFVALNRALGLMVARPFDKYTPRAQLIHHVEPQTDINKQAKAPSSGAKLSEELHIDAADRPTPVRFVSMQCVRADPAGEGRSRLMDSHGFRAMLDDKPDMIKVLEQQPVPWKIVDYLGGGINWHPVLTNDCVYWRHYSIDMALAQDNVELADEVHQVLATVDQLCHNQAEHVYDFLLEPGDFLIVDNHRCLHARSPITDPNTRRLMLRGWVE
jgi:alpha-ketoglutarate-dependent taurine dioxygenase